MPEKFLSEVNISDLVYDRLRALSLELIRFNWVNVATLAERGQPLPFQALGRVATVLKPPTIYTRFPAKPF